MKPRFDHIVVSAYLLLAALPAIGIYTRFDDRQINGVLLDQHRPKLTAGAFLSERYQHAFAKWFENRLGFKGYSVRIDNSILYHAFGETKHGSRVAVGLDGVLYERDDLEYFGRYGPYLSSPAVADAFAEKVAKIQGWFRSHHRGFIPVIIPSKTTVYRAEIPAAWKRPIGSPPPTDEHVYRALVRAFDAHGVRYVDARAMLEQSTEPRARLWGSDARHWSTYAACLSMREAMGLYAEDSGRDLAPYSCDATMEVVDPHDVDHDLVRLLNAWRVDEADTVAVVAPTSGQTPASSAPSALITGCSFSWTLLRDAERSKAFGPLDMNYYNQTFVSWPQNGRAPVEPGSAYWQGTVLDKDLIILDLTETYALGSYSVEFVDELATALGL